jgi:hypothetical protein
MKSYTTEILASQASPLFQVTVIEDDDSTLQFQIATNDVNNLNAVVSEAYQSIKNPTAPKEPTYKEKRKSEYPPVEDYLDGIVKGDQDQVQQYIDTCNAVKAKYPKE